MAEASKDSDQSMEDILQSIKRIIADEGEPSPNMAGSDVLELTDLLAEDTAVPVINGAAEDSAPEAPSISLDDIMAAPTSSTIAEPSPTPAPTPEPVVEAAAPAKPEPMPAVAPAAVSTEPLMSDRTLSASLAALNALSHSQEQAPLAAPQTLSFRSGTTVEDLVVEALKPLLKEWLDSNLPNMVTALVEKEIRRLSAR